MKYALVFALSLLPFAALAQDSQFKQGPNESDHDYQCRQLLFMLSYNGNSPEGRQLSLDTYKAKKCGIYGDQPEPQSSIDSKTKLDGAFWSNMSEFSKDVFAEAFLAAYRSAFALGYVKGALHISKLNHGRGGKRCRLKNGQPSPTVYFLKVMNFSGSAGSDLMGAIDAEGVSQQATFATVVKGMDDFYRDPTNTPVCMSYAIQEALMSPTPALSRAAAVRWEESRYGSIHQEWVPRTSCLSAVDSTWHGPWQQLRESTRTIIRGAWILRKVGSR